MAANSNEARRRAHLALVNADDAAGDQAGTGGAAGAPPAPLLPRIAAGDEAAVREAVERYGRLIWSLVRRWTPDPTDAEDAVQETFIALWKSAGSFDPARSTESGFVAMVTRRRLIDRLRRRQRAIEMEPIPADYDAAEEFEPDLDREARVHQAREIIRSLPAAQRQMLELSLLHGRTHDEIATATGTPLGTVKSHIRRGLQKARALLAASTGPSSKEQDA